MYVHFYLQVSPTTFKGAKISSLAGLLGRKLSLLYRYKGYLKDLKEASEAKSEVFNGSIEIMLQTAECKEHNIQDANC